MTLNKSSEKPDRTSDVGTSQLSPIPEPAVVPDGPYPIDPMDRTTLCNDGPKACTGPPRPWQRVLQQERELARKIKLEIDAVGGPAMFLYTGRALAKIPYHQLVEHIDDVSMQGGIWEGEAKRVTHDTPGWREDLRSHPLVVEMEVAGLGLINRVARSLQTNITKLHFFLIEENASPGVGGLTTDARSTLVTGSDDCLVRIWDVALAEPLLAKLQVIANDDDDDDGGGDDDDCRPRATRRR